VKVRQVQEHSIDCHWDRTLASPWTIPQRKRAIGWRDRNGQWRGMTTLWLRMYCQDPRCRGEVLVKLGDLSDEVEATLVARKDTLKARVAEILGAR
jgi:hypothetical protein